MFKRGWVGGRKGKREIDREGGGERRERVSLGIKARALSALSTGGTTGSNSQYYSLLLIY